MARRKLDLQNTVNFKYGKLEQDNVFVGGDIIPMKQATGFAGNKSLDALLVVQNKVVNAVSNQYGFLRNEEFFGAIEQRLGDAGIAYNRRSINRENTSFRVDYILNDESFHVNIKGGKDKLKPMISARSSYDGSSLTGAHVGFFREICSNGNHIADTVLNFQFRRRNSIFELYMDKIEDTIAYFMDNEFYSLHKKFEVLAESPISSVEEFVKYTLGETGLFKYEKSEKNADTPSTGAQFIIDIINAEAAELQQKPNLWLGYNAFNEYIHTQNERPFMVQERADKKIFQSIMEQVN